MSVLPDSSHTRGRACRNLSAAVSDKNHLTGKQALSAHFQCAHARRASTRTDITAGQLRPLTPGVPGGPSVTGQELIAEQCRHYRDNSAHDDDRP